VIQYEDTKRAELQARINYIEKRIEELEKELTGQVDACGSYSKWTYITWCDWLAEFVIVKDRMTDHVYNTNTTR
jgi:hypothetical protein